MQNKERNTLLKKIKSILMYAAKKEKKVVVLTEEDDLRLLNWWITNNRYKIFLHYNFFYCFFKNYVPEHSFIEQFEKRAIHFYILENSIINSSNFFSAFLMDDSAKNIKTFCKKYKLRSLQEFYNFEINSVPAVAHLIKEKKVQKMFLHGDRVIQKKLDNLHPMVYDLYLDGVYSVLLNKVVLTEKQQNKLTKLKQTINF